MSAGLIGSEIQNELSLAGSFESFLRALICGAPRTEVDSSSSDDVLHDIQNLTSFLTMINEYSRRYTSHVAAGKVDYDETIDDRLKDLWRSWMTLARVTLDRVSAIKKPSKELSASLPEFRRQFAIALTYEEVDFDHHAKAIINAYKPNMENFMDAKFPQEFWDSPE